MNKVAPYCVIESLRRNHDDWEAILMRMAYFPDTDDWRWEYRGQTWVIDRDGEIIDPGSDR